VDRKNSGLGGPIARLQDEAGLTMEKGRAGKPENQEHSVVNRESRVSFATTMGAEKKRGAGRGRTRDTQVPRDNGGSPPKGPISLLTSGAKDSEPKDVETIEGNRRVC